MKEKRKFRKRPIFLRIGELIGFTHNGAELRGWIVSINGITSGAVEVAIAEEMVMIMQVFDKPYYVTSNTKANLQPMLDIGQFDSRRVNPSRTTVSKRIYPPVKPLNNHE